jgi:polysaccharide biosynthesis PFTS motif protein
MIFKELFRKRKFSKMHAQLRGAKLLKEREDPYFVSNTISDLTEVSLGLQTGDFPEILVGSHAANAEITLRQYFLMNQHISPAMMQSIGGGNPIALPIPPTWVAHLVSKGISCSPILCQMKLYLFAVKIIITSIAKFIYLAVQRNNPKYPGSPYVVFMGLQQNNLPGYDGKRDTRDLISWYKDSIIKRANIRIIWVQAIVNEEYDVPNDLVVSRIVFPKFSNIHSCLNYILIVVMALIMSFIGVLCGKWWYGFIIAETINLHYVKYMKREFLAEEYYFNNSSWYYKPMWAYEIENYKKTISQLYYSTNNENFASNDYKSNITQGFKIMKWKCFIVWDQQQEDHLKQYCPNANFIKVGYVDITGETIKKYSVNGKKILSLFDVTPLRPITYTKLGVASARYYSEDNNLNFLQDIKKIFTDDKWIILWKPKRIVGIKFISNSFKRKQAKLINGNLIKVDPGIAASSLVETSDAVISMPFSSPSVIAKFKNIPCIFYDTSGCVKKVKSHGIPLLRRQDELKEWMTSLTKETS